MKSLILIASLLMSSLALACPEDKICVGSRVMDSDKNIGDVVEVYNNGTAKVLWFSYYSTVSISKLAKGVPCNQRLCVGDRVNDTAFNLMGDVGKVVDAFENGMVRVWFDGHLGYSKRHHSELGKGYRCIEEHCVGGLFKDKTGTIGEILEIFDNGHVKVLRDGRDFHEVFYLWEINANLKCRLGVDCIFHN